MPGNNLTIKSKIICPHGGQAILFTKNTKVFADGTPVLLETDIHPVAGCPFTVGTKYSPCVRIEWSAGGEKVTVNGTAVLVKTSIGKCINAEGATQGIATIVNTQIKVSSR
ncbi:hypothetical protein [Fischerella sp. PCC 9605]|uniref:hypothetical protein n=1 Tax=Fischerella sp. PCC 9605 TaxID=1173024 RepID=UPI000478BEFD|nr:hypothetical protein [Fischerella sp. PCC 9605]